MTMPKELIDDVREFLSAVGFTVDGLSDEGLEELTRKIATHLERGETLRDVVKAVQ